MSVASDYDSSSAESSDEDNVFNEDEEDDFEHDNNEDDENQDNDDDDDDDDNVKIIVTGKSRMRLKKKIQKHKQFDPLLIINCHIAGRSRKLCDCLKLQCPNNGANQTEMVALIFSVRAYADDIRWDKVRFDSFMLDVLKGIC